MKCCAVCMNWDRDNVVREIALIGVSGMDSACRCLVHPEKRLTWDGWGSECPQFVKRSEAK